MQLNDAITGTKHMLPLKTTALNLTTAFVCGEVYLQITQPLLACRMNVMALLAIIVVVQFIRYRTLLGLLDFDVTCFECL